MDDPSFGFRQNLCEGIILFYLLVLCFFFQINNNNNIDSNMQ